MNRGDEPPTVLDASRDSPDKYSGGGTKKEEEEKESPHLRLKKHTVPTIPAEYKLHTFIDTKVPRYVYNVPGPVVFEY